MNKLTSLSRFLGVDKKEITKGYNENVFEAEAGEYLVLTNKEADKMCKDYILETAWAFNSWFIRDYLNSKYRNMDIDFVEELIEIAQEHCNNEMILKMITKRDFVNDAVRYDGRGHFLASYDGNENEQDCYYIYRIN